MTESSCWWLFRKIANLRQHLKLVINTNCLQLLFNIQCHYQILVILRSVSKMGCVTHRAFTRWSFHSNSAWGSKETMTIGETHPHFTTDLLLVEKMSIGRLRFSYYKLIKLLFFLRKNHDLVSMKVPSLRRLNDYPSRSIRPNHPLCLPGGVNMSNESL